MRTDRGIVLLEVLVSLVILATAGASLVALVSDGIHAVDGARARELTYHGAEGVMSDWRSATAKGSTSGSAGAAKGDLSPMFSARFRACTVWR